jgi:hypothetical protein
VPTAAVGTACADGTFFYADGSGPSAPWLRAVVHRLYSYGYGIALPYPAHCILSGTF